VLKNPYIASGLRLNVDVAPDDGRLWLAAIHGKGRLGLCDIVPGFYTGRAAGRPDLFLRPCARVSIRAAGPVEVEFDGDPRGRLPVSIEVRPKALRLIGCRGASPG
jgi:diacylglycerol kinase family enzyme